ncbi:MAG: TetR/AcrR family transcriptional regulator [Nitriliruptorales bacterium]|nr:TetR/AcrR family transcriptional regulator [Nitriliruptorales bacterium]
MTGRASRDKQRAQTRQDLLDAAGEIFARKGYHAASVDDVAEAAGFTKGAVYSNFASKEDLFFALYEQHVERAVRVGLRLLGSPPEERGVAMANSLSEMGVLERDWHLLEMEFVLFAARNERMRELVAEQRQRTRERVAEIVGVHLRDIGGDDTDAMAIARLIIAALNGLADDELIEGDSHGHLIATLIDMVTTAMTSTGRPAVNVSV